MSRSDYPDSIAPRAAFDPTLPRPVDPRRAEVRGDEAKPVAREAVSSRTDPRRADSRSTAPGAAHEYPHSQRRFSGLDLAAFLAAAVMTLGPLAAAALANMHS